MESEPTLRFPITLSKKCQCRPPGVGSDLTTTSRACYTPADVHITAVFCDDFEEPVAPKRGGEGQAIDTTITVGFLAGLVDSGFRQHGQ